MRACLRSDTTKAVGRIHANSGTATLGCAPAQAEGLCHSLQSPPVVREIDRALQKEDRERRRRD